MTAHALGEEWAKATHRALMDRNAELVLAIRRCLESAVEAGIIEHDCFAILQAVAHDGIRGEPECSHPDRAQKWFELRREIAVRWCSECGALNRDGETWTKPTHPIGGAEDPKR